MFLRKKQPSWVQASVDFSKFRYDKIMDISSLFNRCHVVTDSYFEGSLKEETREDRRSHRHIDDCSEIPPNFISKFLSKLQTKRISSSNFLQSILCITFGDSIISNSEAVLSETDISQYSRAVKKLIQGLFAML